MVPAICAYRSFPVRGPPTCNLSAIRRLSLVRRVTDEALMRAVRDGDLAKLGILFERHHMALFDFLSRMTGDRTTAEDLTQDVFVRMLKYRATFRNDGRFETWMFHIARNARADYFRRRAAVEINDDAIDATTDAPGPAHLIEREEHTALLRRALLLLREDRRELIILARYRGMKHEAIAELLGVDAGTVKVRIHRALKELRDIFRRLAGDESWNANTPRRSLPTI
jgi:RNA polymerase sigma factor (sigma-70 family)